MAMLAGSWRGRLKALRDKTIHLSLPMPLHHRHESAIIVVCYRELADTSVCPVAVLVSVVDIYGLSQS